MAEITWNKTYILLNRLYQSVDYALIYITHNFSVISEVKPRQTRNERVITSAGKSVGYVTIRTHTFRQMKSISSDVMWYNTVADKKVPTTYHLFNVADKKNRRALNVVLLRST